MTQQNLQNPMPCSEFESMLTGVLDDTLPAQDLGGFEAHARTCHACGPLLAEADAGRRWLKTLQEVEPPKSLVGNILIATSGLDTARFDALRGGQPQPSWWERLLAWSSGLLAPAFATARQPRFVMSFGMAFFALSASLSLAGVKLSDVRHLDLRPSAVKRTYFETSGRVVKYYENIRFVYEIESRVRDFKRATVPEEPAPEPANGKRKDDTSQRPEKRQDRNYAGGESDAVFAFRDGAPEMTLVSGRRSS